MPDPKTQTESQLEQRIVDLEQKLEDVLMMSRDFHLFSKLRDLLANTVRLSEKHELMRVFVI